MTDKISPKQRSAVMSKIKATSQLENKVAKELYKQEIRYRRNNRKLFGSPDISILDSQKIITWSGAQHLRCYIIATASS